MSTKSKQQRKSTTKLNYTEILILEKVGLSHEPLSSHEIRIESKIISGDIHRYIRKLCPLLRERGELLFNLNGIKNRINNPSYKLELIKKINGIYNLKLNTKKYEYSNYALCDKEEYEEIINSEIKITFDEKNNICIYFENYVIIVVYSSEENDIASLLVLDKTNKQFGNNHKDAIIKKEANLIMKKNNKSEIAFYSENKELMTTTIRYRLLDVSLSNKAEEEINRIKKEKSKENPELTELDLYYLPEVVSIRNNTKNWLYSLNLRGLIYYLNYNYNKNNEQKIFDILTNPILLKHAPFLYNCQFFKDIGFPVVRKMINMPKIILISNILDTMTIRN